MSPPITRISGPAAVAESRKQARQRALEWCRIADQTRARRERRRAMRRHDHEDLGGERPDGVDRMLEQRSAVDRLGQLVAPEPARPAAGEDDRGDGGPGHRRLPLAIPAAALGPGRWPSGVRRRIPRRSRSARIAITYLRLVPVASRRAAGVSGARRASATAVAAISL